MDFFKLNGWITETMVLPMIKFSTRAQDLSLVSAPTPSTFPLILMYLTTTVPTGFAPPVKAFSVHRLLGGLSQQCGVFAPAHCLHHVRIDCPSVLPTTEYKVRTVMDLMRRLNQLNSEDGSTILASLTGPRYPVTYGPVLVTPAPTGYTIFDWH